MQTNDESDHLLPDLSVLLGISIDRWIDFFIFVSATSSLCYTLLLAHGVFIVMHKNRGVNEEVGRPRKFLRVIVEFLVFISLHMLRFRFERRLRKNGDMERGLAWDPIDWLIGFFLYGISVEVMLFLLHRTFLVLGTAQRRLTMSDLSDDRDSNPLSNPKPSSPCSLIRFSWYLLYIGSECLVNFCVNRRDHNYEYYGPMRLTRLPSLHNMEEVSPLDHDQMNILPRLGCNLSESIQKNGLVQPYILATLELGWGRQWGCRNQPGDKENWNTNWPPVPECTSFLCDSDMKVGHACPCYSSEEEARNATWECLNLQFDLTRLQANETFDYDQPPWDDPTWPSSWRYGNCNAAVGTSMDPIYVTKVKFNGQRQQSFGLVCLAFWLLLVIYIFSRGEG